MESTTRKRLLILAALFMGIIIIFAAQHIAFATTGTKFIPKDLPSWYIYPGKGVVENAMAQLGKEQYAMIKKPVTENPPGFPDLSPYRTQATYQRGNSIDKYRIVVWYFDNRTLFVSSENLLLAYLDNEGNVQDVSLDMSREDGDYRDAVAIDASIASPDFPRFLNATSFYTSDRSGYFFAIKKPILWAREDYFILGYLAETGNLTGQRPYLEDLIARGYYNVTGSYGKLEREE